MEIKLEKTVARNSAVEDYDVRQVKKALNRIGLYQPLAETGITGIPDAAMFDAVKAFQREHDIDPSGIIKPEDETVEALNREASKRIKGFYIWRTVGDKRVRESHAALEGDVRSWDDDPDPGDEFNCRCWAEPVSEEDIETLYPDAIEPTISPLDFVGGGLLARGTSGAGGLATWLLTSRLRDTSWIRNASRKQLQKKFKHAKVFGIKGNMNNKNLEAFRKALENHVKSPDTKVIKGTYHRKPVTHYYNNKTGINLMRDGDGTFMRSKTEHHGFSRG